MTSTDQAFPHLDELFKSKLASRNNHDSNHAEKSAGTVERNLPLGIPRSTPSENKEDVRAFWRRLRAFYRDGQGGGLSMDGQPLNLFPALLAPYMDMGHVRHDYPVWIADTTDASGVLVRPLVEVLRDALSSWTTAPGEARILRDNLARLEMILREALTQLPDPCPFADLIGPALQKLETQLDLSGPEGKVFSDDLVKFRNALPAGGRLAVFSEKIPFLCLAAAIKAQAGSSRQNLTEEVHGLLARLRDMLRIEKEKSPEAKTADSLKGTYGYGASFINFDKFSTVLPDEATEAMAPERRSRIERILAVLDNLGRFFQHEAVVLISKSISQNRPWDWSTIFSGASLPATKSSNLCGAAQEIFDDLAGKMVELMTAVRIARLETEGHYDPEVHDTYFRNFDWTSFTETELATCPPVILLTKADDIVNNELSDFSRMLSSCRPVKTLVVKETDGPFEQNRSGDSGPVFSFQQELGAVAVSHRSTYVLQSTAIHPTHLFEAFSLGLSSQTPAVFHVLSPARLTHVDRYVWTGAALESRAFPEFVYDQRQGIRWGSRFNVQQNPQADKDWPSYDMVFRDADQQDASTVVSFTLADFEALNSAYSGQFMVVPPEYWTDDLILFSDYLKMEPTEAYARVPFIWMTDQNRVLNKVATTHFMILFAQERLDFWHFIQEFGGINSFHVDRAVEQVRRDLQDEKAREMAALEEKHRTELDEARHSTAREAMEKLSAMLLDLDTMPMVSTVPATRPVTTGTTTQEEDITPAVSVSEEETAITTEPWIETFRCTTCNECTNLNPNAFKYDGNKQAYLADANACTYAQLVTAAEKCTAKCIHPGLPLNPNEPGLDDLLKRAAPFN